MRHIAHKIVLHFVVLFLAEQSDNGEYKNNEKDESKNDSRNHKADRGEQIFVQRGEVYVYLSCIGLRVILEYDATIRLFAAIFFVI